jgi:hypothetical protein
MRSQRYAQPSIARMVLHRPCNNFGRSCQQSVLRAMMSGHRSLVTRRNGPLIRTHWRGAPSLVLSGLCVLHALACGGRVAPDPDEARADAGTTSRPPSCDGGACGASQSPGSVDASTRPSPDATVENDATTADASDAEEDAALSALLAPCIDAGNVVHFEVLGADSPLPLGPETFLSVEGFGGPGGPIGSTNSLFVRLESVTVTGGIPNNNGLYMSMPFGSPLGSLSCNDLGPVVVEFLLDGYTCEPQSGTVDIFDLQLSDDAGDTLHSLLVAFDTFSNNCTGPAQVTSGQELRGCASFGE